MAKVTTRVDDIHKKRGDLVEATVFDFPIQIGDRKGKLDLTEEHAQLLKELGTPWLDAVESQTPVVSTPKPRAQASGPAATFVEPQPVTDQPGAYALRRVNQGDKTTEYPGLRDYANLHGIRYANANIPPELIELYKAARDDGSFVPDPKKYLPVRK